MYTVNVSTGIITRDSDGKIVSPVQDENDPDFIAYNEWAMAGNHPKESEESIREIAQKAIWELIKVERERRKFAGVKVGVNWFHSDPDSRAQQLGLMIAGNNIPPGMMWKTLTPGGGLYEPVEVEMTPSLAQQIFLTTMVHDGQFHAAAEIHRINMLKCDDPWSYNFYENWPESFEDIEKQ